MTKWIATGLAVCLLLAPVTLAEMTLDEVIAKNLEARGGLDRLNGVDSVRVSGKMVMGPTEATFQYVWQRPDRYRLEFEFQGMKGIQAYDGETAWQVMPFMGNPDPELLDEEQSRMLEEQADFDGPFIDPEDKGYVLEYLGEEETEGTPAHKIKVTNKHGDVTYVFLDAEYFLQIRTATRRTLRGQELEFETSQGDFKEVDGLMLAHSLESKPKGAPAGRVITYDLVEVNVDLADVSFSMPEPATESPAEEATGEAEPAESTEEPTDD